MFEFGKKLITTIL